DGWRSGARLGTTGAWRCSPRRGPGPRRRPACPGRLSFGSSCQRSPTQYGPNIGRTVRDDRALDRVRPGAARGHAVMTADKVAEGTIATVVVLAGRVPSELLAHLEGRFPELNFVSVPPEGPIADSARDATALLTAGQPTPALKETV